MEQFSLDKWLQDKSRKVVTRDGRNVRIVCWDRKYSHNDFPIIALEEWDNGEYVNFVSSNGKVDLSGSENIHDLLFADEEEELTELQKTLEEDCDCYVNLYNDGKTREELREWIKAWCHRILDLARKELQPELDKKLKEAYNWGGLDTQEEITKSLPKWKKSSEQKDFNRHVALLEDNHRVVLVSEVLKGEYYIELNDLKTLPKEE